MTFTYQKKLSGKKVGVVLGSFAPLHQGHLDLIMRAKKENDGGCIVISCGFSGDKGEPLMPHARRYRYVREFFTDDDFVVVYPINDTELGIEEYPNGWEKWMKYFKEVILPVAVEGSPELVWYVGDSNYYNDLITRNETAVLVDRTSFNPTSATMIRQNPSRNWEKIASPFRRFFSHNILITGTASEGKSTLTQDLGKYFNAPYSMEWARGYMAKSCLPEWELDGADYLAFLEGQYNQNMEKINSPGNHGVFFADSDSMVTRMYAEYQAKDPTCTLTEDEFEKIAVVADVYGGMIRWDKIFIISPHDKFVDDHERYMAHSDKKIRLDMFEILCNNYKRLELWNKVEILDGDYYENFMTVVNYARNVINK